VPKNYQNTERFDKDTEKIKECSFFASRGSYWNKKLIRRWGSERELFTTSYTHYNPQQVVQSRRRSPTSTRDFAFAIRHLRSLR